MSSPSLPKLIPRHIAAIMDGNGRWAKARGEARVNGHKVGAESVRAVVEGCVELGVEYLTLYAFSSENWKRPQTEIKALMALLERFLKKELPTMLEQNVRLHAIGQLDRLPDKTRKILESTIEQTRDNTALNLVLAISYGAREELVDAARSIAEKARAGTLNPSAIDCETLADHLYTREMPDPDLLIRTSGEVRLSNFLLWQLSYTEIVITQKFWPDFRRAELFEAIEEFGRRQRRYGGIDPA